MTTNRTAAKFNSRPIIVIAVLVAIMCLCLCTVASIIGIVFLSKDSSTTTAPTTPTSPVIQELPKLDPQTQTWLIMFYFDADDVVLEEDMYFDLNEVEMVGSTDRVKLVAQIDRNDEAFTGDGDWTSARRYYLTQDDDLNKINSEMIADLGEVDMGNSNTLVDFATWAIQSYPADKFVLILSDHGSGWPGGWTDDRPQDPSGNYIHLNDLESALGQIIANTGIHQFELFGMDACLMSMLEVYNGIAPYAHYAVASQETEPGLGWAFTSFLSDLVAQPEMSGADLGRAIVENYVIEDQRILNDEARQRMLSNYGFSEPISAGELAQDWGSTITLTAVDLSALPQLNSSLDNFLYALKNVDQRKVAEARSYAQVFYNVFDDSYPSPYIDLSNFADFVVKTTGDQAVIQSTQQFQTALSDAILAEKHGDQRPGATGFSIYFPVSQLYWDEALGYTYYAEVTRSSADQNLWDDFLAFHYAGQEFGLGDPSREARLPAPGAAPVTITSLKVTPTHDGMLNIQTDITGDQVAYIYLVGLKQQSDENRYLAYYIDYLEGVGNQVQNGVVYPVWERTNGVIHLNLDWDLAGNGVCDATNCVLALVNPDRYTDQPGNLLYFVDGLYIYSESGKQIEASMYFYNQGDNLIRNIIAKPSGNDSIANPSALIPKPGDQFLTVNTIISFDNNGQFNPAEYQIGNTLTFGEQPFYFGTFETTDPGEYAVGIMVEDMDGNMNWYFGPVTVK